MSAGTNEQASKEEIDGILGPLAMQLVGESDQGTVQQNKQFQPTRFQLNISNMDSGIQDTTSKNVFSIDQDGKVTRDYKNENIEKFIEEKDQTYIDPLEDI